MPELKHKSIRTDIEHTADDYDEVWSWAPDRDIKIKAITCTLDVPASDVTVWGYLGKGAVGMKAPGANLNEEEMIFFVLHTRASLGADVSGHAELAIQFGTDYIEIEEGEKIYLMSRGTATKTAGYGLVLYYL